MAELKWGEEVEYHVVQVNEEEHLAQILAEGFKATEDKKVQGFCFQEEFGSWMVEAVPDKPYGLLSSENTLNECRNTLFSLMER